MINGDILTPNQGQGIEPDPRTSPVEYTGFVLDKLGVWYVTTPNRDDRAVRSCREAADARMRVGEPTIPLWDEMKTRIYPAAPGGAEDYVMFHCRGDRELDPRKINAILGYDAKKLDKETLNDLGSDYGLVNPFHGIRGQRVSHVVDHDLLKPLGVTGTVATNAGHLQWGVLFRAHELFEKLPDVRKFDVTTEDPDMAERRKWATDSAIIAIISGNGPDSGTELKKAMHQVTRKRLGRLTSGDITLPETITADLPVLGETMKIWDYFDHIGPVLEDRYKRLCEYGAGVIAVACNTTLIPSFSKRLRVISDSRDVPVPLVSMPEVVGRELIRRGTKGSLHLLGAEPVVNFARGWSAYEPILANIEGLTVQPPSAASIEYMDGISVLVKNNELKSALDKFRSMIYRFGEGSTVGCVSTEMSILLPLLKDKERQRLADSGIEIIDSLELTAEEMADYYVSR
jgi:aspartate/glutamate racemase